MHSRTGTLKAVEPYEFEKSLAFVTGLGPMSGQQDVEGRSITKAVMIDGEVAVFRVKEDGGELGYELFSEEPLEQGIAEKIAQRIAFFLSLDDDIKPFYEIAREKDPKFYPLVERAWGLHHVKFLTLEEAVCWALINQRIQRPIALRIKKSIVEKYGGSLEVEGKTYWAFPDKTRLRPLTARQLLETTKSERISRWISSFASMLDEMDEDFLRTALYEKARERLEKVNGIGEWSSMFILFRGLGRMGELQQLNIKRFGEEVVEIYGGPKPLKEVNDTYGSFAGYWQLYLWASTMPGFSRP